jgi:hypothetical protein
MNTKTNTINQYQELLDAMSKMKKKELLEHASALVGRIQDLELVDQVTERPKPRIEFQVAGLRKSKAGNTCGFVNVWDAQRQKKDSFRMVANTAEKKVIGCYGRKVHFEGMEAEELLTWGKSTWKVKEMAVKAFIDHVFPTK